MYTKQHSFKLLFLNPYAAEFFIFFKLEMLTQFPAPNDEKLLYLCKDIRLQNVIIGLT